MAFPQPEELVVTSLGPRRFPSPLAERGERFVDDTRRVLLCSDTVELQPFLQAGQAPPSIELAGPRAEIFFAADVLTLTYAYGVRRILGFRYGYAGLSSTSGFGPIMLTPEVVDTIHEHGGTLLGSSRGAQDLSDMVDTLATWNIGILFAIGGDGTLRGQRLCIRKLSTEVSRSVSLAFPRRSTTTWNG